LGLLFVGFGLANVISFLFGFAGGGYTLPKGLMFLFGGIGLLIYYKVTAPQRERVMRLLEKQITVQIQQVQTASDDGPHGEEFNAK
jgi:hypothetical protein